MRGRRACLPERLNGEALSRPSTEALGDRRRRRPGGGERAQGLGVRDGREAGRAGGLGGGAGAPGGGLGRGRERPGGVWAAEGRHTPHGGPRNRTTPERSPRPDEPPERPASQPAAA